MFQALGDQDKKIGLFESHKRKCGSLPTKPLQHKAYRLAAKELSNF